MKKTEPRRKSPGANRWVRLGIGVALFAGFVVGTPLPMFTEFQGGMAFGQESQDTGGGAAEDDPCPPVQEGAFSPCPSQQEEEKVREGLDTAGSDGEEEGMLEGLGMVGGGLVMTTLGFVVLNNLDSFGTDCSGLSEEVDPSTGKSPKDECMDDNEDLIGLGFLFIVTGVVLTGAGVWTFGEGAVDAVTQHPAPPRVRLGLIPCRECRPAPLAMGVRIRF